MLIKIIADAGAMGNQFAISTQSPAPVASEGTKIPLGMPLKNVDPVVSILKKGSDGYRLQAMQYSPGLLITDTHGGAVGKIINQGNNASVNNTIL